MPQQIYRAPQQRLRDFLVQSPINHLLTAKATEQRLQCPHNKERTLQNHHLKHREQLSASPAASGRSQRRGRGFPAHSFFAGPAAAALAPASGPWEDGGPEQRHRRRRLRGSLHRVLHLLRPQEAE